MHEFVSAVAWVDLRTIDFVLRPSFTGRILNRNIFVVSAGYLRFFDAVKWTVVAAKFLSVVLVAEIVFFVAVHLFLTFPATVEGF